MRCRFPEHHTAKTGGKSGAWWPLGAAVAAAVLIIALIHVIVLALACIGAISVAAGVWRLRHRAPRAQLGRGWRAQLSQQGQPQAPHLHFHTAEAVEAFRRAVEGDR
jgi:hypothetical protein